MESFPYQEFDESILEGSQVEEIASIKDLIAQDPNLSLDDILQLVQLFIIDEQKSKAVARQLYGYKRSR